MLHGRPPTLNISHSDCRFPRDLDPSLLPSGELGHGCEWSLLGANSLFNAILHQFMRGSSGTPPFSFLFQCNSHFLCAGQAIHRYWDWTNASGHSPYPRIFFLPWTRREGGIGTQNLPAQCSSSSPYVSANLVSIYRHSTLIDYFADTKVQTSYTSTDPGLQRHYATRRIPSNTNMASPWLRFIAVPIF